MEINQVFTQLTFTCSKSTIETQEKVVKYVQSLQYFTLFSRVSMVELEQVNISWMVTIILFAQLAFTCSKSTMEIP